MKDLIYNSLFVLASSADDEFIYGGDYIAQFSIIVLLTLIFSSIIFSCLFYLFLNNGHRLNHSMKTWWALSALNTIVTVIAILFIFQIDSLEANLAPIPWDSFDVVVIPLYLTSAGFWSFLFYFLIGLIIRRWSDNASHIPDFKTK